MKFDYTGLENLITVREEQSGLKILKYSKEVFFNNLWNTDDRLLECRGLVLDNTNEIVSWPFTKVFNYKENGVMPDLNTQVIAAQKLNGFMATTTIYKGEVLVSTTGSLNSTYVELATSMLDIDALLRRQIFHTSFMFEVCSPEDPHIITEEAGVYLIGARDLITGKMYSEEALDMHANILNGTTDKWVKRPYTIKAKFSDIVRLSNRVDHEGFMVRDALSGAFLCKIKSPYYLNKKGLQRLGKNQATSMWEAPEEFKKRLDEEFYGVFDAIIWSHTKEGWLSLSENERSTFIYRVLNND